jgi:hypothetical protein
LSIPERFDAALTNQRESCSLFWVPLFPQSFNRVVDFPIFALTDDGS